MSTTLRSRTLKATSTWDRDTASETKTKTRRFKEESRPDGQHSLSTATSSRLTSEHAWRDKIYNSCVFPANDIRRGNMGPHHPCKKYKLAATQTNMKRSISNITFRDRKTNIWVREKTKVTDMIEQVRRRKWTWAWHVSRILDNWWTLPITTWKSYERKRPRGRPARRWRDLLHRFSCSPTRLVQVESTQL